MDTDGDLIILNDRDAGVPDDEFHIQFLGVTQYKVTGTKFELGPLVRLNVNATTLPFGSVSRVYIGQDVLTEKALTVEGFGASANSTSIVFSKTRGATQGAHATVIDNDQVGVFQFRASDGTNLEDAAEIGVCIDGTPSLGDMPAEMVFKTRPGSAALAERMRISKNGFIGINTTSPNVFLHVIGPDGENASPLTYSSQVVAVFDNSAGEADDCIVVIVAEDSGDSILNFADAGVSGDEDVMQIKGNHAANEMTFKVNTLQAIVIDSSQNVGIGETSPDTRLHIKEATLCTLKIESTGASSDAELNLVGDAAGEALISWGDAADPNISIIKHDNADNSIAFFTNANANEMLTLASNQNVGINNASPASTDKLHIGLDIDAAVRVAALEGFGTFAQGPELHLRKTQATSVGSHTIVGSTQLLGSINFQGSDGVNYETAASIISRVDGTPASNDMPGLLQFLTTLDGGVTSFIRMQINNAGKVSMGSTSVDGGLFIAGAAGGANQGFITMDEITAPGNAGTNQGRIFMDVSGAKTRLMVIFQTGIAQQIAIEP